ncbi:MAG: hypothetical protein K6U09_01090 [Acidobacteriia bacterium]|jgi:hypothetical protein|nr:hypothetical protein [Terriglobia bacterium]
MNRRRALGWLLVALMLLVVVASRVHGHDSVSDFCLLCHIAHLFGPASVPADGLILPDFLCWYSPAAEANVPAETVFLSHCSRAPPGFSSDSSFLRAA